MKERATARHRLLAPASTRIFLLVLLAVVPAVSPVRGQAEQTVEATGEAIAGWVRELDDDRFMVRRTATEKLILAGEAAVQPVVQAMAGSNLEVATRGIYILRELAVSNDVSTQEAAAAALEHLAQSQFQLAARQAADAVAALGKIRQQRALKELADLGAGITELNGVLAFQRASVLTVEIGPAWQGTVEDLQRLKWMPDVRRIAFIGKQVTDDWIRPVEYLDGLEQLTIKHASITDAALSSVTGLKRIALVDLMYTPVTDACLEHLKGVKTITNVRLYGTGISEEAVNQWSQVAAHVNVDFKKGAFLGVLCSSTPFSCQVQRVTPGSAAHRGGIEGGDIIFRYGGRLVSDFDGLKKLIAANKVGDSVLIQVARGGVLRQAVIRGRPDQDLGLEGESLPYGLRLTKVDAESLAGKSGLQVGDVIIRCNGEPVTATEQMRERLRNDKVPGTQLPGTQLPAPNLRIPKEMEPEQTEPKQAEPKQAEPQREPTPVMPHRLEIDLLRNVRVASVRVTFGEWTED